MRPAWRLRIWPACRRRLDCRLQDRQKTPFGVGYRPSVAYVAHPTATGDRAALPASSALRLVAFSFEEDCDSGCGLLPQLWRNYTLVFLHPIGSRHEYACH